jgi:hypothetical protein
MALKTWNISRPGIVASCSPNQRQTSSCGWPTGSVNGLTPPVSLTIFEPGLVESSPELASKASDQPRSHRRRRHIPGTEQQGRSGQLPGAASAQLGLRPRISLELIPSPAPLDRSHSDAAMNEMIGASEIFSPERRQPSAEEHGAGTRAIGPCCGQLAGTVTRENAVCAMRWR